jgi:hypothetical protein
MKKKKQVRMKYTVKNTEKIAVGARFPASVTTGPGTHPASYEMSTMTLLRE